MQPLPGRGWRLPLELDVEAEFFPEVDITTGHALPAPDDDLAFTIDQNHELDLQEVVRQNLLLALPMQAALLGGLPGAVPAVRAQPQQRALRARGTGHG